MRQGRYALACVLSTGLVADTAMAAQAVVAGAPREIAILHIRVLSGEGATFVAGSRSTQPVVVQVTDEAARPVEGATVSFRLPERGPGGIFSNGLRTEVTSTGLDGRAGVFGVVWDHTSGPIQMQVTAVKGGARAGTIVSLEIAASAAPVARSVPIQRLVRPKGNSSRGKWAVVTLVIAGAAAGGLAAGLSHGGSRTAPSPSTPSVQIGSPSITIGGPR